MAGACGDHVDLKRSRSGLAGRRSQRERAAGRGDANHWSRLAAPAPSRIPAGAALAPATTTAAALPGAGVGGPQVTELLAGLLLEEVFKRGRRSARRTCFDGMRRSA